MRQSSVCLDEKYSTTRLTTMSPFTPVGLERSLYTKVLPESKEYKGEGGLRTHGYFKRNYEKRGNQWCICDVLDESSGPINLAIEFNGTHLPLITVVTVVFNGEQFLEETIQSVINQTYPNIEYIIIDGGSNDGTLEIIRKFEHAIDYWVSEKDAGIYDAMNKGMQLATGQWVNFMNAGDSFFCDIGVLEFYDAQKTPMVYGNALVINEQRKTLYNSGRKVEAKDFLDSMPICHQAIFYSKKFILPYDDRYKIIADRVMAMALMRSEYCSEYDDRIQVRYIEGGVSNQLRGAQLREEAGFLSDNGKLTFNLKINMYLRIYVVGPLYDVLKKIGFIKIYRAVKYGF